MKDLSRLAIILIIATFIAACGGSIVPNEEQEPDPVVIDVPVAYIQRDLAVSEGEPLRDLTMPAEFIPGASLIIKACVFSAFCLAQGGKLIGNIFSKLGRQFEAHNGRCFIFFC